jgi:hypothetical protein
MNRLDLPRDLRLNQELKTKVKEQVMARCEDYPCCGHEAGDCPTIDSKGRQVWTCVECGKKLPHNSPSSICRPCTRRMSRRMDDGMDDFR